MSKQFTRRDFLKGAAAGAIGVAGMSILGGCGTAASTPAGEAAASAGDGIAYPELIDARDFAEAAAEAAPITNIAETKEYDVVVVGAGTAGVPAALSAREMGATVACLHKHTAAVSQGNNGSGILLDKSDELGVFRFIKTLHDDCLNRADWDLLNLHVRNSGEVINWIEKRVTEAGMAPSGVTEKEYTYDDGNGGLCKCTAKQVTFGPKPLDCGDAMRALAGLAAKEGVEFFYNTPGVQLVKEGDRIVGVIGKDMDGNYIKFLAKKGVILATGDYQNNSMMVKRFCPDMCEFDKKQSHKTGDGHLMGMMVGAQIEPVGHTHMCHDFDSAPSAMGDFPCLKVNENGERFCNEEIAHISVNNVLRYEPRPGWYTMVFDSDYQKQAEEMGSRVVPPETLENYIPGFNPDMEGVRQELLDTHRADTLEELAEMCGIPADNLVASVNRYNELCEKGFDDDFGKLPKYMKPIKTAPFWGLHKHIRVSAICSGLLVNTNLQVLDADRKPIPGLYAAGNTAGQVTGKQEWPMYLSGMGVGWPYCSGRLAGKYVGSL